jgi:hypothetical protein
VSLLDVAVPDAIEPLVGWRYWRLAVDGGLARLASLAGPHHPWSPGEPLRARCRRSGIDPDDPRYRYASCYDCTPHRSPGEDCTCGIYAARDLGRLRGHVLLGLRRVVVGEVRLWGKVVPGAHGYRAELAYPGRLFVFERATRGWPALVGDLEAYGSPVEVVPDRAMAFSPLRAVANATGRLARR